MFSPSVDSLRDVLVYLFINHSFHVTLDTDVELKQVSESASRSSSQSNICRC